MGSRPEINSDDDSGFWKPASLQAKAADPLPLLFSLENHTLVDIRAPEGRKAKLAEKAQRLGVENARLQALRCSRCYALRNERVPAWTRCLACGIALCTEFDCWNVHHSQ